MISRFPIHGGTVDEELLDLVLGAVEVQLAVLEVEDGISPRLSIGALGVELVLGTFKASRF